MRKTWVKPGLLGAFAATALLAGCGEEDGGRLWSLTAQEDYYSEQAQDQVGREYSNIGTSASVFETNEQERGTGGAGESTGLTDVGRESEQATSLPRPRSDDPAQRNLWLKQDERVPFPSAQLAAQVAVPLGTGKPLQAGPNKAWIQGTHSVELGSGIARSVAPSSTSVQPQVQPQGEQAPPQGPAEMRGGGEGFQDQ